MTFKYGPCNHFFIKCPQVFYGTAAPSYDQNIQSHLIQCFYSLDNAVFCLLPLNKSRIKDQLYIGISSGCNIHDIPDGRACGRCNDPDPGGIFRDGLLIAAIKHTHFFQLVPQFFKTKEQISSAFPFDLLCIELVTPVFLIYIHSA